MILINAINRLSTLYLYFFASLCMLSYSEDAPANLNDSINGQQNFTFSNNLSFSSDHSANGVSGSATEPSAAIESSFEDLNNDKFSQTKFNFGEVASQNSGISNEFVDTGQPSVIPLSDVALTDLQNKIEVSTETSQNATPNLVSNVAASSDVEDEPSKKIESQNITETQTNNRSEEIVEDKIVVLTTETPQNITGANEDIPSFSEWAQKQLEEAEKKKEVVNSSVQSNGVNGKNTGNVKVRSKNYASLDCGAKIVAANPEAVSPSAVLSSSRDEYKLNACQNRIWFVVELCEAVQAKKIDLANFELFSSSPKDFSVYVSDRFPSRDWMNVGHFTAKDERDVQSFDLQPQLFGKFVKVELHSHHGSEHFCPISLFRVYGTSEFEVLEKENQAHVNSDDDEDDETLDSDNGDQHKNLFSSATDAVISIVKKAAEVLGNKQNSSNYTDEAEKNSPKLVHSCTTPSHLIVCDNCSEVLFGEVFELISCKGNYLYHLIRCDWIKNTIYNTDICVEFGLDFKSKRKNESKIFNRFVFSMFSKGYIAALCNTAAVLENKVVLNISKQFPNVTKEVPKELEINEKKPNLNKTEEIVQPTEKLTTEKIQITSIPTDVNTSTSQIKPTKTLTPDNDIITHLTPEVKDDKTVQPTEQPTINTENKTVNIEEKEIEYNLTDIEITTESSEDIDILNELNNLNNNNNNLPTPSTTPQAKESVFLRLSNRIKALERNMSLSSQYLEELSRRYKKQVEEMQRLLDKTLVSLNEESKKRDEHNKKLEEQISELSAMVYTLAEEKNNWIRATYWIIIFLVLIFGILTFCRRVEPKHAGITPNTKIQRRQSIAVVNHTIPPKKIRRPSEEALKISGSYKDLMRNNEDVKKKVKDRKRKKKKPMSRSTSFDVLPEENTDNEHETRNVNSDTNVFKRLDSAPAQIVIDNNISLRSEIEDVPIVLDECENSPLEDLSAQPNVIPDYIKTAGEIRMKRRSTNESFVNGDTEREETRESSPSRSSDAGCVNVVSGDVKKNSSPKKDRKGTIKRIFKKVF
nr:SUN domain-containing ossification factor [Onthophagus taurus]